MAPCQSPTEQEGKKDKKKSIFSVGCVMPKHPIQKKNPSQKEKGQKEGIHKDLLFTYTLVKE